MDLRSFDTQNVEPMRSFDPLPDGWYKAVISDTEERQTKSMTGSFLLLTIDIIEGEFRGRKVFDRLNLNNPNETAVQIAQRTLASVCNAVGVVNPQDSAELRDKPMMIKVVVRPPENGYDASNDIKGYEPCEASAAPALAPKLAASNGSSTPPWKR